MTGSMHTLAAAFSDRRWEIHQAIAEGDTVVLHCTFSGRHTGPFLGLAPANRLFADRQVHIVHCQDGKGNERWAVRDDLSFLCQHGALPSQPARPAWGVRSRSVVMLRVRICGEAAEDVMAVELPRCG
jgi:SnoaL-like polyketide cyclase